MEQDKYPDEYQKFLDELIELTDKHVLLLNPAFIFCTLITHGIIWASDSCPSAAEYHKVVDGSIKEALEKAEIIIAKSIEKGEII